MMIMVAASGNVWSVVYTMTAELYPTQVAAPRSEESFFQIRNIANSFCSLSARIGSTLSPTVITLASLFPELGVASKMLPYMLFTGLFVVDLFLFLFSHRARNPCPYFTFVGDRVNAHRQVGHPGDEVAATAREHAA